MEKATLAALSRHVREVVGVLWHREREHEPAAGRRAQLLGIALQLLKAVLVVPDFKKS